MNVAGKSVQFRQSCVLVAATEKFFCLGLGGVALHFEQLAAGFVLGLSQAILFSLLGLQGIQWAQCLFECWRFHR
ncbi:hypothetical protein D9M71_481610 [compost metagenome]